MGRSAGRKQSQKNFELLQNIFFHKIKYVGTLFNSSIQQLFRVVLLKWKIKKNNCLNNCKELSE